MIYSHFNITLAFIAFSSLVEGGKRPIIHSVNQKSEDDDERDIYEAPHINETEFK